MSESIQPVYKNLSLFKLYLIFVKVGAILLGGGYVILPILQSELCEKRKLIDEAELIDFYALSQSMPGIVAANISMFTGYKLRGKFGAITAMLGIITVPFFIIVLLASVLNFFAENIYVSGAFRGVGVAVVALILLTAREVWQKSQTNRFFYLIFTVSLLLLLLFKLSPVIVIIVMTLFGVILKRFDRRRGIE